MAARCRFFFFFFVLFCSVRCLLCLVDHVLHCDHIAEKEGHLLLLLVYGLCSVTLSVMIGLLLVS